MERHRPLKPCKAATWNATKGRWDIPAQAFKPRHAIRPRSKRGKRLDLIYSQRRKWFLIQPENQRCPVALAGLLPAQWGHCYPHFRQTTQIHHRAGRTGKNYLDESTWLAVSELGHSWIHAHPLEAKKRGWMLSRK